MTEPADADTEATIDRQPHPGGRPPRLTQPSGLLDPEGHPINYHNAICQKIEATGLTATRCAESLGLSRRTVEDWINDGRRHHEARTKGAILTNHEYRLAEFSVDTKAAHARWVTAHTETLDQIAQGGLIVSEVTETVDPTNLVDGKPSVVKRTVKSARTLPDAGTLKWQLERLAKDEFSPRLEVTGADGGPVAMADTTSAALQLAAAADAYVLGVEEGKARLAEQEELQHAGGPTGDADEQGEADGSVRP